MSPGICVSGISKGEQLGFLCEPRDVFVNPKEEISIGFLLSDPGDICVNPRESRSGFYVSPRID